MDAAAKKWIRVIEKKCVKVFQGWQKVYTHMQHSSCGSNYGDKKFCNMWHADRSGSVKQCTNFGSALQLTTGAQKCSWTSDKLQFSQLPMFDTLQAKFDLEAQDTQVDLSWSLWKGYKYTHHAMESNDYAKIEMRTCKYDYDDDSDCGEWADFGAHTGGDGHYKVVTQAHGAMDGHDHEDLMQTDHSFVQLRATLKNDDSSERHRIDNLKLYGRCASDVETSSSPLPVLNGY